MKKNTGRRSAFFNPRMLLSATLCLLGIALAIVAFTSSSAFAQKGRERTAITQPNVVPIVGPVSMDIDLHDLPAIPSNVEEEERRLMRHPGFQGTDAPDPIQIVRRV